MRTYEIFSLVSSEYDKAAKILEEKGSKIKLAKVDATIHTEQAKENKVSRYLSWRYQLSSSISNISL